MPAPSVDLQHLKTSKQFERGNLIYRYWFEWKNRRQLGNIALRLELLDATGVVLTTTRIKLPKVKITGYTPATETSPQKPIYDSTVWIEIDDVIRDEQPVSFRYHTLSGLLSKSDRVECRMDG